jgi:hypothetical protein
MLFAALIFIQGSHVFVVTEKAGLESFASLDGIRYRSTSDYQTAVLTQGRFLSFLSSLTNVSRCSREISGRNLNITSDPLIHIDFPQLGTKDEQTNMNDRHFTGCIVSLGMLLWRQTEIQGWYIH